MCTLVSDADAILVDSAWLGVQLLLRAGVNQPAVNLLWLRVEQGRSAVLHRDRLLLEGRCAALLPVAARAEALD